MVKKGHRIPEDTYETLSKRITLDGDYSSKWQRFKGDFLPALLRLDLHLCFHNAFAFILGNQAT